MTGRPRINLEDFKSQIEEALILNTSIEQIQQTLRDEHGCTVAKNTIRRRIEEWGLEMPHKQTRTEENEELRSRINDLYFQYGLTDTELLQQLRQDGHKVSLSGLIRLRRRLCIFRRLDLEQLQACQATLRQFFEQEQVTENLVYQMGKETLFVHVRQRLFNAPRDLVWATYKEYHAESITERLHRLQQRRGGWTCPGPNFSWSIDGYRKLADYGFGVYGGIDAYSRFIPWFHVGPASCTAWDIFVQYVNVISQYGYIPLVLRADRGVETPMVAAIHYFLSAAVRSERHPAQTVRIVYDGEQGGLQIRDCFIYSKSMRNVKIEAWWSRLNSGRTFFWRVYPDSIFDFLYLGWY
jgi:hypothetical protein